MDLGNDQHELESEEDRRSVFVTGCSGLVGTELITQLLQSGAKVKAIYNHTPITGFGENDRLEILPCNILDTVRLEELMCDVQDVYHCAAIVSFDPRDSHNLLQTNVEGTASVVNAAIASGIKKMVYVSSVAAMGRIRNNETITEEMQWSEKTSNSVYGKSKYLAEMEVWRGIGEGLNAVIINPTIILGGNSWDGGSSSIFKTAYEEFPWYTEGVSGFVSVKDVAKAMILLMKSDISSERFILNGSNQTYRDVFSLIATCFGKAPPSKKVTPFLSEIIWRIEGIKGNITGKKPLLTKETAATAQTKAYFNNSKLKRFLPGFEFESIDKTINDTCIKMKIKYNL